MRVVKRGSAFIKISCKRCKSLIEMLPDELSKVGPPGPYECDFDPEEVGVEYFRCPECKTLNYLSKPNKFEDDTY